MSFSASKTARVLAAAVSFCAASCAAPDAPKPIPPRPHDPPARLLMVAEDRVSVGTNAWVELHARLAAAARATDEPAAPGAAPAAAPPVVPPELGPAVAAYTRTLARDDADELLDATFRGLARCTDDACAFGILEPTGFGASFRQTLPWFLTREWDARARRAWDGVERIHEVAGPRLSAVLDTLVQNLGTSIGPVVLVSEAPPRGNAALLAPVLAPNGPCFAASRVLDSAVQKARLLDCVAVRAVLAGDAPLRATFGERLWTVVVVHEVAALVAGFEPRHVSIDRRAVEAIEPEMLAFVTAQLHSAPLSPELGRRWKERAAPPAGSASH